MTLQVSFEDFPATVKRLFGSTEAYLARHGDGAMVTAFNAEKGYVIASPTPLQTEAATTVLREAGMVVYHGSWLTVEDSILESATAEGVYIAAVSYRSSEERAGVWVDAYPSLPTQVTVLRTMYEEFRQTGELDEVAFEEFVQLASPNAVIVSPAEIAAFLRQKQDC